MADKVKPLKLETPTDGTEWDYVPTETNPNEDRLSAEGVAFENSDTTYVRGDSGTMKLQDNQVTEVTLLELFGEGGLARYVKGCGYGGNAGSGKWLEFYATNPSNTSPYIPAEQGTVRAISASCDGPTTITFGFYINGVQQDTLTITSGSTAYESGLNISFSAGDRFSVKVESGSAKDPGFEISIRVEQ